MSQAVCASVCQLAFVRSGGATPYKISGRDWLLLTAWDSHLPDTLFITCWAAGSGRAEGFCVDRCCNHSIQLRNKAGVGNLNHGEPEWVQVFGWPLNQPRENHCIIIGWMRGHPKNLHPHRPPTDQVPHPWNKDMGKQDTPGHTADNGLILKRWGDCHFIHAESKQTAYYVDWGIAIYKWFSLKIIK